MTTKSIFFAGVAALALVGCGGEKTASNTDAPVTKTSAKAVSVTAKSPLDTPFSFKGGEALDVDALVAMLPEEARPTFASSEFDSKIGATIVTDLQFTDPEDGTAITIDRTELYGFDVDALKSVTDGEPAIDAPFETLFEKVRFFGVKPDGEGDEADVSIGGIEIDKLRVRKGGFDEDAADENPAHFFNAFELGGFYLKDLVVDATDSEGEDAAKVAVNVPDVRLVGLGGGKLSALILNGLSYELAQSEASVKAMTGLLGEQGDLLMNSPLRGFLAPGSQKVSMESFAWNGLDFAGLMDYGLKNEDVPLTVKNAYSLGSFEIKNVESYVDGQLAYKSDRSVMTAEETAWLIPTKLRSESFGDVYNFTAYIPEGEDDLMKIVTDNGLEKVKASSNLSWDWDPKKGGAALKTAFETTGFADFDINFDMSGLEMEKLAAAIEADDEAAIEQMVKFNGLNIKIADEKLLDTVFSIAGLQMGSSGSDLRQSAPAMVRLSGAQFAQMNPRFSDYVDAVADFIADGGSLTISAEPEAPVALSAISQAGETGPQNLPNVLNLNVSHKK